MKSMGSKQAVSVTKIPDQGGTGAAAVMLEDFFNAKDILGRLAVVAVSPLLQGRAALTIVRSALRREAMALRPYLDIRDAGS